MLSVLITQSEFDKFFNIVLSTIPEPESNLNRILNLWLYFAVIGRLPFRGCLDQDLAGMFNEVICIGGRKPLQLEFQMVTSYGLEIEHLEKLSRQYGECSIPFGLSENLPS